MTCLHYETLPLLGLSNKDFHSVDSQSIRDNKITGASMFATANRRKSNSISNEGKLNAKQLSGSKTSLQSHLPQQSSSSHSLPDSLTNNSKIVFDCKVSKEPTSQSISKDLLDSSFEANGFVYDLPIEDDHYELIKQVSISSNSKLIQEANIDMAKSKNSYDNQEINNGFDSQSKENNHNIQREEDRNKNNFSVAAFTNSEDKRMMIEEGHEERDEEYNKYVADDEDNNKVVRTIEFGNNCITSDKINPNDNAIKINKDDISNEKEGIINTTTSHKDNIEMSTKEKESSINRLKYSTNGDYNRIGSKTARSRSDKTSIGYHQKKERIIAMANIDMAKSNNRYDNMQMRSIVDKTSKEQTYNITWNNEDTVHNNYNVVVVKNYEDGSKIIGEGDTEVDGENEKDVVEVNAVEKGEKSKIIAK